MLGACQNEKDAIVSPIAEQSNEANNQKTNVSFTLKRLVNDGKIKLDYAGPQKLISQDLDESTHEYTSYTYPDGNHIKTETRNYYSQIVSNQSVYVLDSEGKCVESHHAKNFKQENGVVYIYKYNSDGRLEKVYNKAYPDERQEFAYSISSGGKINLEKITFYTGNNIKSKEISYQYYGYYEDAAKINPSSLAKGRGKYLPIFGTFNVSLVKQVIETSFASEPANALTVARTFSYTWNGQSEIVKEIKTGVSAISYERKYATYGLL